MTDLKWNPDEQINQNMIPVSKTKMREFGLNSSSSTFVKDLNELQQSPPNIIVAKAVKNLSFVQNYFKKQHLKKNISYIMGLGVYQQLHTSKQFKNKKLLKPSKLKFKNLYKPYKGQPLDNKTILIFRTGGIGDLLFIQPNLIYLKNKYPTCTIKFACGPQYQSMVETWDCVDEVLDLPFSLKNLTTSDYHVLFEGVIERCKLAENVNAFNLFSEWMGLNLPDNLLIPKQSAKQEMIDFSMEKLNNWNIKPNNFILMQIRASSPIRTPRPEFWRNLINELTDYGYDIILTDSPRQSEYLNKFISTIKNPNQVFNFCQYSESLDYTIGLTSLCKMSIATDSAINHITASLDKPCYGIFGPFPGYIRLKTYPKAKWVDAKKECAPCFLHSQQPCKHSSYEGFSPCYDNIDINKIIIEIKEMYKKET